MFLPWVLGFPLGIALCPWFMLGLGLKGHSRVKIWDKSMDLGQILEKRGINPFSCIPHSIPSPREGNPEGFPGWNVTLWALPCRKLWEKLPKKWDFVIYQGWKVTLQLMVKPTQKMGFWDLSRLESDTAVNGKTHPKMGFGDFIQAGEQTPVHRKTHPNKGILGFIQAGEQHCS